MFICYLVLPPIHFNLEKRHFFSCVRSFFLVQLLLLNRFRTFIHVYCILRTPWNESVFFHSFHPFKLLISCHIRAVSTVYTVLAVYVLMLETDLTAFCLSFDAEHSWPIHKYIRFFTMKKINNVFHFFRWTVIRMKTEEWRLLFLYIDYIGLKPLTL